MKLSERQHGSSAPLGPATSVARGRSVMFPDHRADRRHGRSRGAGDAGLRFDLCVADGHGLRPLGEHPDVDHQGRFL